MNEGLWVVNPNFTHEKKEENKDIFFKKLENFEFSIRALNIFKSNSLYLVKDLIALKENEILKFPNSGLKTQEEIDNFLKYHGLSFNTYTEDEKKEKRELIINSKLSDFIKDKFLTHNIIYIDELSNLTKKEIDKIFLFEKFFYEIENFIANYAPENNNIEEKNEIPLIRLNKKNEKFLIKKIDSTNLSFRTINQTKMNSIIRFGDLLEYSDRDLLKFGNFGRKSLNEIKQSFLDNNIDFNLKIFGWNESNINELENLYLEDIKNNKDINEFNYIEDELRSKISKLADKRGIDIFLSYHGFDNTPPKTLQIVGNKYAITRERVRQIIKKIVRKIDKQHIYLTKLDQALEILKEKMPILEQDVKKFLKKKELTKINWDLHSLKFAVTIFNLPAIFRIEIINNYAVAVPNVTSFPHLMGLIKKSHQFMSAKGCYSVDLLMKIPKFFSNNINHKIIKKLLQTNKHFIWLDENHNWYTYFSSRNRLLNIVLKMLKISNRITINDVKGSSRRYYRLEKIDIPTTVLKNFCLFYFDSTIENNLIIFHDKNPRFHSETRHHNLSNTDKAFIQIFSDFGPILSYEDLIDFGSLKGVGGPSITAFLQWSPIVKKIDKGFYILNKKTKELDGSVKIYSQIDLKNSYLDKTECPAIPNKSTYLEVLNNGKLIKTLPYTRPVRKLPDGTEGAVYRKKVYPIIRQYSETETGEREEL